MKGSRGEDGNILQGNVSSREKLVKEARERERERERQRERERKRERKIERERERERNLMIYDEGYLRQREREKKQLIRK